MSNDDIAIVAIDHRTRTVQTIARASSEYTHELADTGDLLVRLPGWVVREHIRFDVPVSVDALLTLAYGEPPNAARPNPSVYSRD